MKSPTFQRNESERIRFRPWPELPCHSCVPHHNGPLGPPDSQGLQWVRYGWRFGYGWHTAGWNRTTGAWSAMCHDDHRVTGTCIADSPARDGA